MDQYEVSVDNYSWNGKMKRVLLHVSLPSSPLPAWKCSYTPGCDIMTVAVNILTHLLSILFDHCSRGGQKQNGYSLAKLFRSVGGSITR